MLNRWSKLADYVKLCKSMKSVFEMQERHLSLTAYFITKNYKSIQFCRAVFVLTGPELWPPISVSVSISILDDSGLSYVLE